MFLKLGAEIFHLFNRTFVKQIFNTHIIIRVVINVLMHLTSVRTRGKVHFFTFTTHVSYLNASRVSRETNRRLYDSNDGLRGALASAAKRRVSLPTDEHAVLVNCTNSSPS